MSTTCRGDLRSQPTAGMTSRSGTVSSSVSGVVARRSPCPVRTEASVPVTVTSNGGTEVATSARRAFAMARMSRTALSPESNRSGTASTAIRMSGTVPFAADPPLSGPPRHGLALVANRSERILIMSVDRGLLVILEARPGQGRRARRLLDPGPAAGRGRAGHDHLVCLQAQRYHLRHFRHVRRRGRTPGAPERADRRPALGQAGPGLLAKDPDIQKTDILAAK